MSAWKVKLFVFWLVIGSSFLISSCTLPTLWDTRANLTHQEATPKSEASSQANTSSGEQAYTGVLSLSGAVKILGQKETERSAQFDQERLTNPDANYNFDYTQSLTSEEIQWLSNYLTQEKDSIKSYDPKLNPEDRTDAKTLFEITAGNNEKYYWINDNGKQTWDVYTDDKWKIYITPRNDAQFYFFIRERDQKKDVVYMSDRLFYGDGWLPLVIFDEKNQVFEMYSSQSTAESFEFDRSFNNKRRVSDYSLPSPLEGLNEGYDITKEPLNVQFVDSVWWDESTIVRFILENSPSLRTSLAKVFSVNENDIPKIIESLEKNRAIPTLSHMSKEWEMVTFELEWLTFTRLKNLGLPQGKYTYTLPKKAVMEMILTESSTLKQEFIEDFGENSDKPFGVALWDKWPNGEDLAWFAWWTSLRPLVVDIDHATYSIPTFDFVFPTMDGAKSLKNEFWRDTVELVQNENSTLPYGSANEKKNLDFAWMRQKNGKIWTASTGNHKWYESDRDALTFHPLGVTWGRDKNGFTLHREILINGESAYKPIGNYLPDDVVVIYDAIFYSKKENKIYYVYQGNLTEVSVIGNKISVVNKYSPLNSPDSICTNNDKDNAYSYNVYDEKVCYWESGGIFGVVGTRK